MLTPNPVPAAGTLADRMAPRTRTWRALSTHGALDGLHRDALTAADRRILPRAADLEARWTDIVRGDTLLRFDLRADNCIVDPSTGQISFVDWAAACTGPAWVDPVVLVLVLVLVLASDPGPGPVDPDTVLAQHPTARTADPDAVTAFLAAISGYWRWAAHQPDIPHAPGLRQLQQACADRARRWLHYRLE